MTKSEKIKEAWGELWNSFNESAKKCALNKDGYVATILQNGLNQDFTEFNTSLLAWRPKSLQGIESNNGWIKIESKLDLPNHSIEYHVIKKGSLQKAYYIGSNRWIVEGNDFPKTTEIHEITHYQPIEKPKPPIY